MSDTQAYRQFGNSVVVPLMSNVARLVHTKMIELDDRAECDAIRASKKATAQNFHRSVSWGEAPGLCNQVPTFA